MIGFPMNATSLWDDLKKEVIVMSTSNKDYLDELIAKAKKSWEDVDVDSYMKNLRDMKTETIRCRDLMVGDWITDEHGFPMQINTIGEDYAYATFEGLEGDPWEFDDKDDQPQPIPITPEILEKNGFIKVNSQRYDYGYPDTDCYVKVNPKKNMIHVNGRNANSNLYSHSFVHELQRALRCCGLWYMADNFKI